MANNTYPDTTLQPLQILDFVLSNGKRVRAMLKPKLGPASGDQVAHVDLECTNAGYSQLSTFDSQGKNRTVMQAGELAYKFAQHEAKQAGGVQIVEILLEGEEFLEKADVERITGNTIPVTVV